LIVALDKCFSSHVPCLLLLLAALNGCVVEDDVTPLLLHCSFFLLLLAMAAVTISLTLLQCHSSLFSLSPLALMPWPLSLLYSLCCSVDNAAAISTVTATS